MMMDSVNGGSYYYRYTQGIKTGSTEEAGYCLVSTAYNTQKNYRYLCVALGAPYYDADGKKAKNGAMIDSKNLYEWAFNELELKTLVDTLTPRTEIKLEQSWNKDSLLLVAKEDFATLVPKTVTPNSVLVVPNDDEMCIRDRAGSANLSQRLHDCLARFPVQSSKTFINKNGIKANPACSALHYV